MVSGVRVSGRALQPLRYGLRNLNLGDDFISVKKSLLVSHSKIYTHRLNSFRRLLSHCRFKVYLLKQNTSLIHRSFEAWLQQIQTEER